MPRLASFRDRLAEAKEHGRLGEVVASEASLIAADQKLARCST
ncbi:hypothetical protein ACFWYW_39050 [Nonomuraea sp. NPDC059023]